MFPPFIDSFGEQFSAVIINAIGTIFSGVAVGLMNAFITGFLTPVFKTIAGALGFTV